MNGELKINDNESKKLAWFNINNFPKNMTNQTKNYLQEYGNFLEEAKQKSR